MQLLIPDLGEFDDVEVIEVLVGVGDTVQAEDPLIVLETDKATMEVPAERAGVVAELLVAVGERVSTGDQLLVLDVAGEADNTATSADDAGPDAAARVEAKPSEAKPIEQSRAPMQLAVPDLGEFDDVEVIEVLVAAGDSVQAEDPLIVLETDKATMEVPAERSGVITELFVAVGDRVSTGDQILALDADASVADAEPDAAAPAAAVQVVAPAAAKPGPPRAAARPADRPQLQAINESGFAAAHASPSVRKLARELGADLSKVSGTGHKGRVTAENLKGYVKQALQAAAAPALPAVPVVDFAAFGEVAVEPLSRIQKIAGPRLQASWVNVPHVTQHDEADITELETKRQELKQAAADQGLRLTPLAFIVRACVLALADFPRFASSLSADGDSLVLKHYRHIGFAADTPNGLVVPVIRDADQMNLYELAAALADLSERARAGKLGRDEIQGGVFTISSLGGIGGTAFTPIINAPEVAILGVSRSRQRPVYGDGEWLPRLMLPLSLSYDHRVIDGAAAARFTTHLAEVLGQVDRLVEGIS